MNYLVHYTLSKYLFQIERTRKEKEAPFRQLEESPGKDKTFDDNINDSITMLTKQFLRDNTVSKLDKSFKCKECERYNHYQAECPNFLKRQKRSLTATL